MSLDAVFLLFDSGSSDFLVVSKFLIGLAAFLSLSALGIDIGPLVTGARHRPSL